MAAQPLFEYRDFSDYGSLPPNLVSSNNSVLIHFWSDADTLLTYTGFKLEYQQYSG